MKKLLSIAALVAVSLVAAQESEARNSPQGMRTSHSYSSQHRTWSSYCWNSRYNCNTYFCSTRRCYYYYYAPSCCYYPVSYIVQYPPTPVCYQPVAPGVIPLPVQVSTPIQITNVNRNTLVNGSPGIPVTAGFVPQGPSGPPQGPGGPPQGPGLPPQGP
jgi:hypothetical protein